MNLKKNKFYTFLLEFDTDRQEHTAELENTGSRRNAGNNKKISPSKQSAGMRDTRSIFTWTAELKEKTPIKRIHVVEVD